MTSSWGGAPSASPLSRTLRSPLLLMGGRGGVVARVATLILLAMLPAGAELGVAAVSAAGVRAPHDLHLAYGDVAVEGSIIAARLRFFKDDLERALAPLIGADTFVLEPGAEADALVLRYVRDRLRVMVEGADLEATLLGSGQDELDLEPVWWVIVQYEASAAVEELRVRNTLLFEVFDDQRNIFKFVLFPDERQRTYYFAEGESEHVVRF